MTTKRARITVQVTCTIPVDVDCLAVVGADGRVAYAAYRAWAIAPWATISEDDISSGVCHEDVRAALEEIIRDGHADD